MEGDPDPVSSMNQMPLDPVHVWAQKPELDVSLYWTAEECLVHFRENLIRQRWSLELTKCSSCCHPSPFPWPMRRVLDLPGGEMGWLLTENEEIITQAWKTNLCNVTMEHVNKSVFCEIKYFSDSEIFSWVQHGTAWQCLNLLYDGMVYS